MELSLSDVANARLANQHVSGRIFTRPKELVSWMGAMQAQDFNMVRWGVGVRLPEATVEDIDKAIDKGEVIRTHVLRPTWHLVASSEIRWMMDLTAPHIQATAKSRLQELELSPAVLRKAIRVIEASLARGRHLTREELVTELERNKIHTREQRGPYILLHAELEKVICSGRLSAKRSTYALFEERVRPAKLLTREEALARLAKKYFQSHGPATLQDFTWWSGIPKKDAKLGIELAARSLTKDKIEGEIYLFKDIPRPAEMDIVHLLPAFDEYVISYKDRRACLPSVHQRTIISINGIFWPVVVYNGQVIGQWKRIIRKNKTEIEIKFFSKGQPTVNKQVLASAKQKVIDFFNGKDSIPGIAQPAREPSV